MTRRTDDATEANRDEERERPRIGRRGLLRKGLLAAGAGVTVSPVGTFRASAHDAGRFEIWAADHLEIDYRFEADGPVEPISHPADAIGAELGGNDTVEYIGGGKYRGHGRTGYGKNDLWRSGTLDKIVITDCRE